MRSSESTLRAVRAQVQFELAEVAAKVAQAAALSTRIEREVERLTRRCESGAHGLRAAMRQARINPPLVAAIRAVYAAENRALRNARGELSVAQRREQDARNALADARNRDRSLERALANERRRARLKQEVLDMARADELWLRQVWSEP